MTNHSVPEHICVELEVMQLTTHELPYLSSSLSSYDLEVGVRRIITYAQSEVLIVTRNDEAILLKCLKTLNNKLGGGMYDESLAAVFLPNQKVWVFTVHPEDFQEYTQIRYMKDYLNIIAQ